MLYVEDVMSRRVVTVELDDDLATVRTLFDGHGFHHLMVVQDGRLAGVISDRDLLRNISTFVGQMSERSQDTRTLARRVHQVMTRRPVTVTADKTVHEAGALMLAEHVSCLPVVAPDGMPVGIVTSRDLIRAALGSSEVLSPEF